MLILDDTIDGDKLVLESTLSGGVKLSLLSNFKPEELEIYETTPEDWDINAVKKFLGTRYGVFQIVGFVIAKIFRLKNNPIGQGVICSELVLMYLLHSPFANEFKHLRLNKTSPEDLYEIIVKSSSFHRI